MLIKIPGSYCKLVISIRSVIAIMQDTYAGVDSGYGDKRTWRAAATVHDVELCAADVKLGAAVGLGDMERDLLRAHEILAAGEARRDGEGELLLAWRGTVSPSLIYKWTEGTDSRTGRRAGRFRTSATAGRS